MTKPQITLLKRCIHSDRHCEGKHDWRLVEVGMINGVDPRTAETLVNAGLLVYDWPTWTSEITNNHVRLPNSDEINA